MKLRQALEEKQNDVRLRDRLAAEGKISKEEIQKMLKQLPDDAANAVSLDPNEEKIH
jgi:Tfp pilus assembly protein PilO